MYLIRDNDSKFGPKFDGVAEGAGIEIVKIPPKSPDLNPLVERFLGSVRRECLDHIVILNEEHLRSVVEQYTTPYFNVARPHQGLGQRIPGQEQAEQNGTHGKVGAMPILGGLHHDSRWVARKPDTLPLMARMRGVAKTGAITTSPASQMLQRQLSPKSPVPYCSDAGRRAANRA